MLVLMLPPLKDFPEAPKDQSEGVPIDCPKCKQKAWISTKKREILKEAKGKVPYFVACYYCIEEFVAEYKQSEFHKINI